MECSPDEVRLLRLIRCLSDAERNEVLQNIGCTLVQRNLIDARTWVPELEPTIEDALLCELPASWPEQGEVHLDNLGDPGIYMEEVFSGCAEDWLLGTSAPDADADMAELLLDMYLARQREDYFPLSTEFGATQEEMEDGIRTSFLFLLREWRKQVCHSIEGESDT
jgi:hypothetical protein